MVLEIQIWCMAILRVIGGGRQAAHWNEGAQLEVIFVDILYDINHQIFQQYHTCRRGLTYPSHKRRFRASFGEGQTN